VNNTNAQPAGEREADTAEAREAAVEEAEVADEVDADAEVEAEEEQAEEEQAEEEQAEEEQAEEEQAEEAKDEGAIEPADEEEPEASDGAEAAEDAFAVDLERARAEAESYLDDLRRLQADFDNYRKRTLREQTARAASASQALVTRLLPVLDNFELAVSAAEQSRDFDRMLKGVEMVFGELRQALEGEGLVKIEAEGKPFDPERHEAVIAVEEEDTEPGMVVDIVRAGYELRGKVLRPAMVKVAK
jgi:molecular chaperone GrpE